MRPELTQSVSVTREHFVCHLAGAIASGVNLDPILRAHGVAFDQLATSRAQISYSKLTAVRLAICKSIDDESEGFQERAAPWGSTVLMCRAIVSSRTLREALARFARFTAILNDEVQVILDERDNEAIASFAFENRKKIDNRADIENRIHFVVAFAMWLIDRRFRPNRIGFAFAKPEFADDYGHIVPSRYYFDQTANTLVFDRALLREQVRQSPRTLNQFLANHHAYLINESLAIASVTDSVRRLVEASIRISANLDGVATALMIPPTTLRRRLKEEGESFQAIKDEVRKRRALHYLRDKGLTVGETADLTGYSDPAVFSRAFKSWTGISPSVVREASRASAKVSEGRTTLP